MNLISLDDLKTLMQISDNGKDVYYQRLIDLLSKFLQNKMKRDLEYQAFSITVDGDGSTRLELEYPVYEVTVCTLDGVSILTDCTLYKGTAIQAGFLYYANGFSAGIQNVHVEYKAGFSYDGQTPNSQKLPEEIIYLAYLVISSRAAKRGKEALVSESKGDVSITFRDDDIPAIAADILQRYSRTVQASQENNFFMGAV